MVELLAPAGNIESLDAAIGEGADAVYLGLKSFNARLRTSNFAWNQFEAAVSAVHRQGKKIYVTVNTLYRDDEFVKSGKQNVSIDFFRILKRLVQMA